LEPAPTGSEVITLSGNASLTLFSTSTMLHSQGGRYWPFCHRFSTNVPFCTLHRLIEKVSVNAAASRIELTISSMASFSERKRGLSIRYVFTLTLLFLATVAARLKSLNVKPLLMECLRMISEVVSRPTAISKGLPFIELRQSAIVSSVTNSGRVSTSTFMTLASLSSSSSILCRTSSGISRVSRKLPEVNILTMNSSKPAAFLIAFPSWANKSSSEGEVCALSYT